MDEIKRITSFTVDHDLLEPGIYISRVDGDVTTYDLRTRKPNSGNYMDNVTMHSMEHMFATYIRNSSFSDKIIYFGPMGCRTGFYLLVRDLQPSDVLDTVKAVLRRITEHNGPVFGAHRKECGNYRSLRLDAAKKEAAAYLGVLENSDSIDFKYREA